MYQYMALPVIGFVVGLLIISLGGGGGAIYVGLLTTLFGIPPAIAASTSLATTIPTTAVGTFSHWKAENINWHLGLTMLTGGVAGSIIGSLCSGFLPESLYSMVIGITLLLLALQILVSYIKRKGNLRKNVQEDDRTDERSDTVKAVCFGLLGGIMSGLVGLSGGGPIIAGLMILGCPALETVGTSVLVLFGIAVTGFVTHLGIGNIDWELVGLLTVGTVCGAFVGPVLLKHLNREKLEKTLQPLLFIMLVVMGGVEVLG